MGEIKMGGIYRRRNDKIVPLKKVSFIRNPDPVLKLWEKYGEETILTTAFGMKAIGKHGKARLRYAPSAPLSGAVKGE